MQIKMIRNVMVTCLLTALVLSVSHRYGQPAIGGQDDGKDVEVEQHRSEAEISVRQLNEFHLAILGRVLGHMDDQKETFLNVVHPGSSWLRGAD